jgi:hypothetical protein
MAACAGHQSLRHFGSVAEGYKQSGCEHQTCDLDGHEETKVAACKSLNMPIYFQVSSIKEDVWVRELRPDQVLSGVANTASQLRRMNRNRNILAHELTLALEDEPVRLRGNRQLGPSTDQELVSLAQSRCPTRLVAERNFACEIA